MHLSCKMQPPTHKDFKILVQSGIREVAREHSSTNRRKPDNVSSSKTTPRSLNNADTSSCHLQLGGESSHESKSYQLCGSSEQISQLLLVFSFRGTRDPLHELHECSKILVLHPSDSLRGREPCYWITTARTTHAQNCTSSGATLHSEHRSRSIQCGIAHLKCIRAAARK
jgi:hypothetical protein